MASQDSYVVPQDALDQLNHFQQHHSENNGLNPIRGSELVVSVVLIWLEVSMVSD